MKRILSLACAMFLFVLVAMTMSFVSVKIERPLRSMTAVETHFEEQGSDFSFSFEANKAMADESAPTPEGEEEVKTPTYLDGILNFLSNNAALLAMVIGIMEALMRLVPTKKAKSILIPVSYAVNGLSVILAFLAEVLKRMGEVANVKK